MDSSSRDTILVMGPESSGNRLVLRMLKQCGFQDLTATQNVADVEIPPDGPVVWLRSWPHAGRWPPVRQMVNLLRMANRYPVAICPLRDWWSCSQSQVVRTHVPTTEQAIANLRLTYATLFFDLHSLNVRWVPILYSSLVKRRAIVLQRACEMLGVKIDRWRITERIKDEDSKWYS